MCSWTAKPVSFSDQTLTIEEGTLCYKMQSGNSLSALAMALAQERGEPDSWKQICTYLARQNYNITDPFDLNDHEGQQILKSIRAGDTIDLGKYEEAVCEYMDFAPLPHTALTELVGDPVLSGGVSTVSSSQRFRTDPPLAEDKSEPGPFVDGAAADQAIAEMEARHSDTLAALEAEMRLIEEDEASRGGIPEMADTSSKIQTRRAKRKEQRQLSLDIRIANECYDLAKGLRVTPEEHSRIIEAAKHVDDDHPLCLFLEQTDYMRAKKGESWLIYYIPRLDPELSTSEKTYAQARIDQRLDHGKTPPEMEQLVAFVLQGREGQDMSDRDARAMAAADGYRIDSDEDS